MSKVLETERMILRDITPDDCLEVFKWCGDPRVNRFMIYPLYKSADEVKKWLTTREHSDFDYGFVLKETGELIGCGGIYYCDREKSWHIGYNLRYDMWGKGLTTEAMRKIVDFACIEREIHVIEAMHAKDNPASGRVMEKLGLKYVCDTEYEKEDGSERFPAKLYRLER